MNIKNYALLFLLLFASFSMCAKDYRASLFGINSDGKTLNTTSIQFAINYINANGGGRLVFNVGRYLTGTINLKSNVTLHFDEGAVLLGSVNPFDYEKTTASWGRLVFNVGRYLTGTINLKSNVTLHFDEGAVLLGSVNPFDYEKTTASWC